MRIPFYMRWYIGAKEGTPAGLVMMEFKKKPEYFAEDLDHK